jgi:hypothetical protein
MRATFQSMSFILALWAIVFTAIIPSGYMVDSATGTMTICTLDGAKTIPNSDSDAPIKKMSAPCVYSGIGTGWDNVTDFIDVIQFVWFVTDRLQPSYSTSILPDIFIGTRTSQGPPATF